MLPYTVFEIEIEDSALVALDDKLVDSAELLD